LTRSTYKLEYEKDKQKNTRKNGQINIGIRESQRRITLIPEKKLR